MSRQAYETKSDLAIEKTIAIMFATAFNLVACKIPPGPRYSIDYCFKRTGPHGLAIAVGEIKDRPKWKMSYGNVFLGASKVRELYGYHEMGFTSVFIVRLLGKIYYTKIDERIKGWTKDFAGRTDRGDPYDEEPIYKIPFGAFTLCPCQEQ